MCVCLCVSHINALCKKRLYRSRCRLGADTRGHKEPCIYGGSGSPHRRDNWGGCTCTAYWEALGVSSAVYAARGYMILNNGMKERQRDCRSSVSHYISPWKNPPLRCGLSSKFFDHLLLSRSSFQQIQRRPACRDLGHVERRELTVVVDPAAAVRVDICNHVVDVRLCQVVSQILQNPSATTQLAVFTARRVCNAYA